MPIIRGPNQPNTGSGSDQTKRVTPALDPYADKTIVVGRGNAGRTVMMPAGGGQEEKTRLVGGHGASVTSKPRDFMDDPVVGWLVIVDGPGKGQALKIGYGQSAIGRAQGQRIQIDFGDDQISREDHGFITYDPKGRKFYVQLGGGANLIYVGDSPVLAPTELTPNTTLTLGATTLRFVPLCGSDFDWQGAGKEP